MPAEWTDCVIAHSDDETMVEKRWEEGEEFSVYIKLLHYLVLLMIVWSWDQLHLPFYNR